MSKTFNLGLGMIGVVREEDTLKITKYLKSKKEKYYLIGTVRKSSGKKVVFIN